MSAFEPGGHYYIPLESHQYDNLVALGRYLVAHRHAIGAAGGLVFGLVAMLPLTPPPQDIAGAGPRPLPPLAYGPMAGVAADARGRWPEDWLAYTRRAFGIMANDPLMFWLQASGWQHTDPSPEGVALRIAYFLDYGLPGDFEAISEGRADTDYDDNGFLWDRLDMLPTNYADGRFTPLFRRRRGAG